MNPATLVAILLVAYALTRPEIVHAFGFAVDTMQADETDEPDQLPDFWDNVALTLDVGNWATDTLPGDQAAANEAAFLAVIIRAEGTARNPATGAQIDPYRTVMGYGHTLRDLSDHPYFTREWQGAYFGTPPQLSTAAGAYQFLRRTWSVLRDRHQLPDFGPHSQDRAAIELIRERGALDDVRAGRFAEALRKCAPVWASLPGAGYGQQERKYDTLAQAFTAAGGTITA